MRMAQYRLRLPITLCQIRQALTPVNYFCVSFCILSKEMSCVLSIVI